MELVELRLKKIQTLMSQKRYQDGVPHILRAIKQSVATSPPIGEIKLQMLQLTLARAIIKGAKTEVDVESLLRDVLDGGECSREEKSDAAHFLAQVIAEKDSTRLDEAKEYGEVAVEERYIFIW
jgi:hypothetical protein